MGGVRRRLVVAENRDGIRDHGGYDRVQTTLGGLDEACKRVGQHDRDQRVGAEDAPHGRIEGGDLLVQAGVGQFRTEVRESYAVGFDRCDAPNQARKVLDRQSCIASTSYRHLPFPPDRSTCTTGELGIRHDDAITDSARSINDARAVFSPSAPRAGKIPGTSADRVTVTRACGFIAEPIVADI